MRKQQVVVVFSTIEAEYMEVTHAYNEAIWIMKLCFEVAQLSQKAITIQCDSNNAICLAKKPTFHAKRKHIYIYPILFH